MVSNVYIISLCILAVTQGYDTSEKAHYRDLVTEMFFHAYDHYMQFAYPADELMPLSCKGRVRGSGPSRGDIDECLGSFSLTLVDSLDTLAVIGAVEDFNRAIRLVINDVKFNADLTVSVFETNIRILGGLLGGHFAAQALRDQGHPLLQWYSGQLVDKAKDVGDRLLPAFNTTTGLPYARVNLRHGANTSIGGDTTCTACAGTMLMEMAALSRLTGHPEYESKAHQAMEVLWDKRHDEHDLVGTVINVHNGQWTRKDSGVGAGIDSYYEYCLKGYILLGEEVYLQRFAAHYNAIKKYISQGPLLFDVNMNTPGKRTRQHMDALLAFWPGLQVLWGDISSAVNTHEMLYHVTQHNKFIPEAFSAEFRPVWPQHPLRPEFIESTYFLYKATGDPYYLDVGKTVIENLNKYARVSCGFASIKDVKHSTHEDRLDSFVLAETFKYLYLLFSEEDNLILNMDDFIFTTEAHLMPLSLATTNINNSINNSISNKTSNNSTTNDDDADQLPYQCMSINIPYSETHNYQRMMLKQCSASRYLFQRDRERMSSPKQWKYYRPGEKLSFTTIDFSNSEHVGHLNELGLSFEFQEGGKVLLVHHPDKAVCPEAAKDGWQLLQNIIQSVKTTNNGPQKVPKRLRVLKPEGVMDEMVAGPAMFGPDLGGQAEYEVIGELVLPQSPLDGCMMFEGNLLGRVPLIVRGGCMFVEKVRNAERSGAIAAIIYDNQSTTSNYNNGLTFPFTMSGDNQNDVTIPSLLISHDDGQQLIALLRSESQVEVLLTWDKTQESSGGLFDSGEQERHSVKSPYKTCYDLLSMEETVQELQEWPSLPPRSTRVAIPTVLFRSSCLNITLDVSQS